MLLILFYCLGMAWLAAVAPLDTLQKGQMINSRTSLFSAQMKFTMGFYISPVLNFSYLAIWHTNFSDHPVWVANRNTPIYGDSGVLIIDPKTGKLMITHNRGSPIELYSGLSSSNTTTATLLDSGNFVLKEDNHVLWQSFDYPTDTLLPGMKLGLNHKTNKTWSLTSWLGKSLPASGAFTLEWDPREGGLIVKRRGVVYWTSGVLKDNSFEFMPQACCCRNLNNNDTI